MKYKLLPILTGLILSLCYHSTFATIKSVSFNSEMEGSFYNVISTHLPELGAVNILASDPEPYSTIIYNITESLDLSDGLIVSLKIKSDVSFDLRTDLTDESNTPTSFDPVTLPIIGDGIYHVYNYYFDGRMINEGGGIVDSTNIESLQFFANPGVGFTGEFIIDEIRFGEEVPENSGCIDPEGLNYDPSATVSTECIYPIIPNKSFTFNTQMEGDFFNVISTHLPELGAVNIVAYDPDPYSTIIYNLPEVLDLSDGLIVSLKIKSDVSFDLRTDLTDESNTPTSFDPVTLPIIGDGIYHVYNYYFDGRMINEDGGIVDSTNIESLQFFANPGVGFTGEFIIDEIRFGEEVPENSGCIDPEALNFEANAIVSTECIYPIEPQRIFAFDSEQEAFLFYGGGSQVTYLSELGAVNVQLSNPALYNVVIYNIPEGLDLSDRLIASLKIKSDVSFDFRVDLTDGTGLPTSLSPVTLPIIGDGMYHVYNYYYDGKMFHTSGSTVDSTNISSIQCFANPGIGFIGEFIIDEIRFGEEIPEESVILGCTNSMAVNYDPLATVDDGTCVIDNGNNGEETNWDEVIKAVASDRGPDRFGNAVSISGNYAIVGAWLEDENETGTSTSKDAGSAYVFERNSDGDWIEVNKLVASDRGAGDAFGFSVSISGNYAIVGAYREDHNTLGSSRKTNSGSAYVFERNSAGAWVEVTKLVASDRGSGDEFGRSVSISGDYAIAGTLWHSEDVQGNNTLERAGASYVYERDGSGNWIEVQKLVASDRGVHDSFGSSVSISGDYAVIGAYQDDEDLLGVSLLDAGSAYIFERDGSGNWIEVQKLVSSERDAVERFAFSVSISGDYVIIGAYQDDTDEDGNNPIRDAGSAHIFERDNTGNWLEVVKLVASDRGHSDNFGYSVSISGNNAIVGAYFDDQDVDGTTLKDVGAAYVFNRDVLGNWTETNKLTSSDKDAFDNFGRDVSISENQIIVGARLEKEDVNGSNTLSNSGSVYFFENNFISIVTGVATVENTNVSIYPNPVNENVLYFSMELTNVIILDTKGRVFEKMEKGALISIESLNSGVYYLKSDEGVMPFVVE